MSRRSRLFSYSVRLGFRALLVSGAVCRLASAQAAGPDAAEALFRSGKEALAQKDYARACPMLADSFAADPATGTLLALALCYEGQGKFGSAWRTYNEVASRSARESRPDREKAARDKAAKLEPQLSMLTVQVAPESRRLGGVELKRDGIAVNSTLWDKPFAVDGGSHIIEISARGKQRWRTTVSIAPKLDSKTIAVPLLEDEGPAEPAAKGEEPVKPAVPKVTPKVESTPATAVAISGPSAPNVDSGRASALQGAGVATFIGGVVGIGVGSVFAIRAIGKNKDSEAGCIGDICTAQGRRDRWDAYDAGNLATTSFIVGGTLAAGGVLLYLLGRPSPGRATGANGTGLRASVGADAGGFTGVLQGTFQ